MNVDNVDNVESTMEDKIMCNREKMAKFRILSQKI